MNQFIDIPILLQLHSETENAVDVICFNTEVLSDKKSILNKCFLSRCYRGRLRAFQHLLLPTLLPAHYSNPPQSSLSVPFMSLGYQNKGASFSTGRLWAYLNG